VFLGFSSAQPPDAKWRRRKIINKRRNHQMRSRFIRPFLLAVAMLFLSSASFAQIGVAITIAPPELPVYEQPICPGDGYIWTPGYWAWGDDGYYWVPGTWVEAPQVGFFWTPGYWGWGGAAFIFHEGYWGPVVGFYGGINYGFGYVGHGYEGGRWDNGHFFYNRSVNNVNVTVIHNVYNTTVVNREVTRVSYNGGNGGINERPTAQEEAAARERHIPPVAAQVQHVDAARANPELRASVNHGKPAIAATPRPGAFNDRGAVPAREGSYNPPARTENNAAPGKTAIHPKELPPAERPAAPNTGNAKLDKKYQQQQTKLGAQQDKERQQLQKKQDQEHQTLAKQNAGDARKQQVEQQHQQQTQQLQQKHTQQQQQLQQRQAPPQAAHESKPK
jgi:WXXGXW repeat (2 copies)